MNELEARGKEMDGGAESGGRRRDGVEEGKVADRARGEK